MPSSVRLSIDRITSASGRSLLQRLAATDLVERGCVTLISVEAIRERMGDRWFRRRDDVWAYVERKLDEHLAHQDIRQRVNETDFLIAMTLEEGVAVQAVSLKVLEEVLLHFLGAADPVDLRIRAVGRIDGDEITGADLDPTRIAVARQKLAETGGTSPYRTAVDAEQERRRNPVSFVAAGGRRLRIDFALEHVVSLRHRVTAALRVQPTVSHEATGEIIPSRTFGQLLDDDIAVIDAASLAFAALFIPTDTRSQPPLILPSSFRTLGARKGRNALINLDGVPAPQLKKSLIVELVDIDRGTPQGRLVEVAGLVGGLVRAVFARVQPVKAAMAPVQGARLAGLTLDGADLVGRDSRIANQILAVGAQARGLSPTLMVQGLPSEGFFHVAQVAGFTHAGVRVPPITASQRPAA